jgi:hypothetical protein
VVIVGDWDRSGCGFILLQAFAAAAFIVSANDISKLLERINPATLLRTVDRVAIAFDRPPMQPARVFSGRSIAVPLSDFQRTAMGKMDESDGRETPDVDIRIPQEINQNGNSSPGTCFGQSHHSIRSKKCVSA